MVTLNVSPLGDFLREQRRSAQLSLRQLAEQAATPSAYLGQLERGLRKPSAEVLQQIARGLRVSADQLYAQAGAVDHRSAEELAVESALLADGSITERQKRVLLELYHSFRAEAPSGASSLDGSSGEGSSTGEEASPEASSLEGSSGEGTAADVDDGSAGSSA